MCYGKSGCRWRVGRLQRNNRAGRGYGNKGIPQELLILLPMAVRALPARPMCCHPMSASSSGGVKCWSSAGDGLCRTCTGPEDGPVQVLLQGDAGATCAAEKGLHVAQLFLWCPQMVVRSHHVSVWRVGEKKAVVELTKCKEEVIKISGADTFRIGLHSEISLPNGQARAIFKPLGSSIPCAGCATVILLG